MFKYQLSSIRWTVSDKWLKISEPRFLLRGIGEHNLYLADMLRGLKVISNVKDQEWALHDGHISSEPAFPAPMALNICYLNKMEATSVPFMQPIIPKILISLYFQEDQIANSCAFENCYNLIYILKKMRSRKGKLLIIFGTTQRRRNLI